MSTQPLAIRYQDADCMVIEKPAGMVVNRAESVTGETVQDWVEKTFSIEHSALNIEEEEFTSRSGIVHRIDKETSGLLLIAKNPVAFANLQLQFRERVVKKKYVALVHGLLTPTEGEVNVPIGRLPWNRTHFGVFPGGREAQTNYQVIKTYYHPETHEPFSYVSVLPHTGRTHQIRVHLKYINHPIVADELYAGRKTARDERMWCPRLFLHAAYLKFRQPTTGEWIEVTSELPDDLRKVIEKLSN